MAHVGNSRQRADRCFNRLAKIGAIHGCCDIERAEIAGNILTQIFIRQIILKDAGFTDLKNFRAKIAHGDTAIDRVGAVHRVFEHDVRIAGLELNFRQNLEEVTCIDLLLANTAIIDHFAIFFGDGDFRHRHAIDAFNVIRREEIHILIVLGEFKGDIRDYHAKRQRLDADFLIRIFALGVEEAHDVGVMRVQINGACTLTCTKLVCIRETVFQQLHYRDDARRLVLDLLDWCTGFTDIGKAQRHAAAAL